MKKQWSMQRIVWAMNLLLLAVMLAGSWVLISVIQDGRQFNLKNIEQSKLLSVHVNQLLEEDFPLALHLHRQLVTIQQVEHEITLYVLGEVQDTKPLKDALGKLAMQFDMVARAWPEKFEREALEDLRGSVTIMEDIAEELYVTRSPVQLDELAEDTQAAAEDMVRTNARVNKLIEQEAALAEKFVRDANQQAMQSGKQMEKVLSKLVGETIAVLALVMLTSIIVVVANILFWNRSLRREITQKTTALEIELVEHALVERELGESKEMERMKSEFLSTVSHELRTPLASIVGYADLLVDGEAGEINEIQREFLEIMSKNALRLTDLVGDLLDIEKLEGGRVALSLEPLDLYDVLLLTYMTFKVVAEEKGLQLQVNGPQGLMINGDKDRLVQVFSNLTSNSIKYTKEGSVEISAEKAGDVIRVSVRDTGIGMDAQVMEKLYSKFFRAGDVYTQAAEGTGLGLAIAKAIVIQHGGTIEVSSKAGEGSNFTVSLPSLEIGKAQQSDVETTPMRKRAAPMVLCVMADDQFLQSLKPQLLEAGIICRTATSAEDCMRIAQQDNPALITLDAVLEDQEGWEVIKRLKNDPETAGIPIVLTSLIEEKEALRLGASAVVPKEVKPEELLGILLRLLKESGRRVLIVDDDRDFADVLQRTLRKKGLESDICLSGANALKACTENNYEAIVLDYNMPAMSGLEVLKRLKLESRRDLHVICISGSTVDKWVEQEALTLGSEIFLNKKIGIAEITQAIQVRMKLVEKR